MHESWRLVGRDAERDFLGGLLDSQQVSGCVIAGQAGVGKTRLARELMEQARGAGRDVEWLVAVQGTSQIALAVLAPALGRPPPQDSAGELLHWAVQQLSKRPGLVLCIDDAHLLDPVSASLLLQMAARRHAFVVATVRSGGRCPVPVTSLWTDGWAERLELGPLSRDESATLVGELLNAEPEPEAVDLIYDLSAGVPLFLREILIAGADNGSIDVSASGRATWRGPFVPTTRLAELVTTRVGQLLPPQREALNLVSLSEPIPMSIAVRLADGDVLADLETRGLLVTDDRVGRTTLRVAHPLYSEVIRETLPTMVRRDLHRRLAEAATSSLDTAAGGEDLVEGDLVRIATWRLESGDHGDAGLLVAAAELSLRNFDTDLAERLGRAAIRAGAGMRAELIVADALYYANRWGEAASVLDGITGSSVDDITCAHAAIRRASLLIWSDGDPTAAYEHLDDMEKRISDADLAAEVGAERVWALLVNDRVTDAVALAERYVGTDAPAVRAAMRALPAAVVAHAIRGSTDTAMALAERAGAMAESGIDLVPTYRGDVLAASAFALWLAGNLAETVTLLDGMTDDVAADWSDGARGLLGFIRGKALVEQGHAAESVDATRSAIGALEVNDIGLFLPWAYYVLARGCVLINDLPSARRALAAGDRSRMAQVMLAEPDRLFAIAAISDAASPGDGAAVYAEATERFESSGALLYALIALAHKTRTGGADPSDPEVARDLASRCQGRLAPSLSSLVTGMATRDPDVLSDAACALEAMGLDLHAAEAAFVAAAEFDNTHQNGAALAARQIGARCQGRCGAVHTPMLSAYGGDAPLATLTRRERQVARLVATGFTNRQVADRLEVSGRTVDNHVQHIYTKLGIHDRNELSALF